MADDADKTAIIELLNLYGFALDAHAWDLFDQIFADDVVAEFGPAGNAWVGLEEFKRSFAEFHATLDSHQHTMMGQLVHVDGDTANAFAYGNWLLIRNEAEGGATWTGTGWYDDELVRTGAGWRIKHRVCRLQSWTGNPFVPVPNSEHRPDMQLNVLKEHAEAGRVAFLTAVRGEVTVPKVTTAAVLAVARNFVCTVPEHPGQIRLPVLLSTSGDIL